MPAPHLRRLVALALAAALPSSAFAADILITCPKTEAAPALELRFNGSTLAVSDADGAAELPARLNGDPGGLFTLDATGPAEGPLPPLADFETCLAAKLAQQGAQASDPDAVTFALNQCRLALKPIDVRQPLELAFTVTSLEAGSASLFTSRRYLAPSALTGAPLTLDEWPMRECKVA